MSDGAEQNTETLSEESQTQEESNYSDVGSSGGGTDENLRNFGGAIAVCALLPLFGGTTFAIWSVSTEAAASYSDSSMGMSAETELKFGVQELEYVVTIDGETESEAEAYGDNCYVPSMSGCILGEVESFMNHLKIMLYVLVICGVALVYIGHSGKKMEFAPKVIVAAALISVVILLYTFISLPAAFEEDSEWFEMYNVDPGFRVNEDIDMNGIELTIKAAPGIGYFIPIVSLGICGYMVKDRGITLEDITG